MDGFHGGGAFERHAQAEVHGQVGGIDAVDFDGVEEGADAVGVEAYFADYAGFGYLGDCGFALLDDFGDYEVGFLGGHPLGGLLVDDSLSVNR